jgi:hypothetical protein
METMAIKTLKRLGLSPLNHNNAIDLDRRKRAASKAWRDAHPNYMAQKSREHRARRRAALQQEITAAEGQTARSVTLVKSSVTLLRAGYNWRVNTRVACLREGRVQEARSREVRGVFDCNGNHHRSRKPERARLETRPQCALRVVDNRYNTPFISWLSCS